MAIQKITTDIIEDNAVTGTKISVGTPAAGDIFYYDGTDYTKLPIGNPGQTLVLENGLPIWGVGEGSSFQFQGTQFGFCTHGNHPQVHRIQKYSFTSDANATHVNFLTYSCQASSGGRSQTHGYAAGGEIQGQPNTDIINRYSFASGEPAEAIPGTLTVPRTMWGGQGASSGVAVYWHGGSSSTNWNTIDKHLTATDNNATDVGDLHSGRYGAAGASSDTHGYAMGGCQNNANFHNLIERYAFASDGNSVDTNRDLFEAVNLPFASNSTTHIYVSGGMLTAQSAYSENVTKFAIDSSANAVDIGNLSIGASGNGAGTSSTTHGYCHGGWPSYRNVIEKISFSTDGGGVDVGDLDHGVSNSSSSQH